MQLLLFGKDGQIGWELRRTLAPLGQVVALGRDDIDLSQPSRIKEIIRRVRPHVIINAAAYTDVDRAEIETEQAWAVNAQAPVVLAQEAQNINAALIHYSTDYVFDGTGRTPYREEDTPNPLNTYGRSKLEGEQGIQATDAAYLILRTSWVYGLNHENFLSKVLHRARTEPMMRVVVDQAGNPTWSRLLAECTTLILAKWVGQNLSEDLKPFSGIYHVACDGRATRYEWAREILQLDPMRNGHRVGELVPAWTEEFPSHVRRPAFSALDSTHFFNAFGLRLPNWKDALQLALSQITSLKALDPSSDSPTLNG